MRILFQNLVLDSNREVGKAMKDIELKPCLFCNPGKEKLIND